MQRPWREAAQKSVGIDGGACAGMELQLLLEDYYAKQEQLRKMKTWQGFFVFTECILKNKIRWVRIMARVEPSARDGKLGFRILTILQNNRLFSSDKNV